MDLLRRRRFGGIRNTRGGCGHFALQPQEPVAQSKSRQTVIPVVVLELDESLIRCGDVADLCCLAILVIPGDGLVPCLHVAGPQLIAHVERLELLDAVGRLRDTHRPSDRGVQVDEYAVTEQVVELVLVGLVRRRPAASAP